MSSRGLLLVFGLGALVSMGLGLLLIREIGTDVVYGWIAEAWQLLQTAPPIVFFGAMSILTIFPVPLSPFYITAGTLYGIGPSLLWIPPAIVLNNLIAHALTTSGLRPWLQAIVAKRGHSIPKLESKRDQSLFIVLVRITPGPPYFLQSILLGLAGVDRLRFLVISLPVHMVYAVGFVVLGRSAFEGELGLAVIAIGLIFATSIGARFIHKQLSQNSESEDANPPE